MPQSLARLHVHLVFSTKNRERTISDAVRDSLHAYLAVVLQNLGCAPVLINSVEDHVHVLVDLGRTVSVSGAVEEVKKSSSKWIKTQAAEFAGFAWQAGYSAFAVSESNVEVVRDYIAKQHEHHRTKTFQDEYRQFLERHRIAYDERYVWDCNGGIRRASGERKQGNWAAPSGLVDLSGHGPRALPWAGVECPVGAFGVRWRRDRWAYGLLFGHVHFRDRGTWRRRQAPGTRFAAISWAALGGS